MAKMLNNIPAPLPDECLRSYGFRISATHSQPLSRLKKLLHQLSEITGLSTAHLIHQHTHIGYQRFVNGEFFQKDISTHPDVLTNYRLYSGNAPVEYPNFCPNCIDEDIEFHGVSYWRRAHQLPGVDHCSKHTTSLVMAQKTSIFFHQPLNAAPVCKAIPASEQDQYLLCTYIHRFSALSDLAMQARIPLSPAIITRILVARKNALLSREHGALTQLAIEKFPTHWLKRHFPLIFKKANSARISVLDEVLRASRNAYTTKLYLLAMSLLWDDPDEAMNACLHEATVHTSGFHERGGEMALQDVLLGDSIHKSCIRHGVHVRDFEFVFQKFLEEIRPIATSYASRLASPLNDGDIIPAGRVVR